MSPRVLWGIFSSCLLYNRSSFLALFSFLFGVSFPVFLLVGYALSRGVGFHMFFFRMGGLWLLHVF